MVKDVWQLYRTFNASTAGKIYVYKGLTIRLENPYASRAAEVVLRVLSFESFQAILGAGVQINRVT